MSFLAKRLIRYAFERLGVAIGGGVGGLLPGLDTIVKTDPEEREKKLGRAIGRSFLANVPTQVTVPPTFKGKKLRSVFRRRTSRRCGHCSTKPCCCK